MNDTTQRKAYAAVWLDDYDSDFGVYKVFAGGTSAKNRSECINYLVDMVFDRAGYFEVDVTKPTDTRCRKIGKPTVKRMLNKDGTFTLAIKRNFLGYAVDKVSVGIREVEVV